MSTSYNCYLSWKRYRGMWESRHWLAVRRWFSMGILVVLHQLHLASHKLAAIRQTKWQTNKRNTKSTSYNSYLSSERYIWGSNRQGPITIRPSASTLSTDVCPAVKHACSVTSAASRSIRTGSSNIQLFYWLKAGFISRHQAVTHSPGHARDLVASSLPNSSSKLL